MRNVFLRVAAVALGVGVMLAGCDKPKAKPAEPSPAPGKAQTVYGSAMERGKATECLTRVMGLKTYLVMGGEYLPASREDFNNLGCPDEMLSCPGGEKYEFLVTGKVRNAGKVKVLRCPVHELVLWSDGSASSGSRM